MLNTCYKKCNYKNKIYVFVIDVQITNIKLL